MGVDFSGAQTKNTTDVTLAVLRDNCLELEPYQCLPRRLPKVHQELSKRILCLPRDAVVALDFPFAVPQAFANEIADAEKKGPIREMPDLWSIFAEMEYCRFEKMRNSFVKRHGELMRRGDGRNFGGPFSPLHIVNPGMLKMTFHGMRMLHGLWQEGCRVPPLPNRDRNGPILL